MIQAAVSREDMDRIMGAKRISMKKCCAISFRNHMVYTGSTCEILQ